jgi:uncharacterized protein YdeI (YjbR/CyaY-like superfamily)
MNEKVNWFFEKESKWQEAYTLLREIVLESSLNEALKWGCPCYTNNKSNIVLIHGFKEYCALLFMQGALLSDPNNILVQQTENVQSARQIRFKNTNEIQQLESTIKSFIEEAIKVDNAGIKAPLKKVNEYKIPEEFNIVLEDIADLKTAFYALTPGRQRGYLLFFAAPKQSKTRTARIEKYLQQILDGKGLEN